MKMNQELDRRDFMKKGAQATAAAAATVLGTNAVQGAGPDDKKITFTDALPARELGKTKVELPMLGYGGAALPKKWGNTLSDRRPREAGSPRLRQRNPLFRYRHQLHLR